MEATRQQHLQDDRMSECRSFGSNHHPCSQSRKISIGVVVESLVQTRSKTEASEPTAEKVTFTEGNLREDRCNGERVAAVGIRKQLQALEQETSPWVSTRSIQKIPIAGELNNDVQQNSSLPVTSCKRNRSNGGKVARTMYSVQYFANQMSTIQTSDGNRKKPDRLIYRRNEGKDNAAQRVEKISFPATEDILPEKQLIEDKTNKTEDKGSEALKVKLWEILGTASSPKKRLPNSEALEMGANNLKSDWRTDENGDPVVKLRQNSDTIESDSENPDHNVRRPVACSLKRKRSSKVQSKKIKNAPSFGYKQKHLDERIFSFEEGWSRKLRGAVRGSSSVSKRSNERKSSRTDPHRLSFPDEGNEDEIQQTTDWNKTKASAEKSSLFGTTIEFFDSFLSKKNSELLEPKHGIQEKDSHQSPVMKMTDKPEDIEDPMFQENMKQQEDLPNLSLKNIVDPQHHSQSSKFDLKTTTTISSLGFPSKGNRWKLDDHGPLDKFYVEGTQGFKNLPTLKSELCVLNMQAELPDDTDVLEDSPALKSVPIVEEKGTENRLSKSSDGRNSESSEDCSSVEGHRSTNVLSPEIGNAMEEKLVLHPFKRLHSQGTAESYRLQETSELNHEDGLASAVALFALALERVRRKIKAVTIKKSAEILISAADEIHLLLQNAESQIQIDVGKLAAHSKLKGKHLETRFQDQQNQLKVIHERFKEQVNQHLQDCRGTLEGLEAQQIDLKGAVTKQKAAHRRLLSQAEQTIEIQLNDVQRRITGAEKLAREKMHQLQSVIVGCLKEDIFS